MGQAKGIESVGPKAARLTAPPQLGQIRTALENAMSAGSPRTVITSLEPEADKLAVLTEVARQIGARMDAARAHKAEEHLKERWTMPGDPANQQEKTSAQAALDGQGGRGNDHESCVGISPGRTWTGMLTLTAIAYHVRTQQQWDPTLGFPGEGGSAPWSANEEHTQPPLSHNAVFVSLSLFPCEHVLSGTWPRYRRETCRWSLRVPQQVHQENSDQSRN